MRWSETSGISPTVGRPRTVTPRDRHLGDVPDRTRPGTPGRMGAMASLDERISTFSRDGLHFDVTDEGPLDGDVVVLLHGFPTDRTSWDQVAADVLALIDASGRERVHLVGHDWGGALAWLVAGNHPTRIASLTVLSTPHPAAMSRAWRSGTEQKRKSWYMAAFQVPRLPERAL